MYEKRPQADRLLIAEIWGEARRRAKWRELGSDEEAAAVTELRQLAGGRADLLAEVVGVLEGTSEGELDEPLTRQAAMLCRKAGADLDAIPAWIEEGRRRRDNASRPPFSGGVRGPRLRLPWLQVVCATRPKCQPQLGYPEFDKGYSNLMNGPKIRLTAVIMDVLDVLTNSPPDDPAWGLRLCEATGYGTGTIYPALDRLMKAGWITGHWEDPPPVDRPARRFYEMTSTGREQYAAGLRARRERRAAWLRPTPHAGAGA